uniref:Uncharacterized protein n=1 Tax=Schizaphis graminum TaxID=13262 RepID=A0A2S2PC61_SCHGA
MARNIVYDSESWGRCYFLTAFMDDKNEDVRVFCVEKKPKSMGKIKLRRYAILMIQLANKHHLESMGAINRLPREIRGTILASTEVYRDGIIDAIQSSSKFPYKAKLTTYNKLMILFKTLYIESMQYVV